MTAIDPDFRWQPASSYRLEPITWLEGRRDYLSPIMARWEGNEERKIEYEARCLAIALEDDLRERVRQSDELEREFPERDEALVARTEFRQCVAFLERHKSRTALFGPPQQWHMLVMVAEGMGAEYSPLHVNLAEQLLWMIKKHSGPGLVGETALLFCPTYGDLTHLPVGGDQPQWWGLADWQRTIFGLHRAMQTESSRRSRDIKRDLGAADVKVALRHDGIGNRPKMVLKPLNLISMIGVQFAELASGGTQISNCQECGRPFFHGGSADRKAGAIYCLDDCRERHKTKRRAVARKEAKVKPKKKKGR